MASAGSTALKIFGAIFYAFWLAVALIVGTGAGWMNTSGVLTSLRDQELRNVPPENIFNQSVVNLLVLGCDEDRDWQTQKVTKKFARSDMILCLRLDFQKRKVSGLSIPRDLELTLQPHGTHKINAYHDIGGKTLAETAVETVLGVSIDRTVVLDYEAFKRMVDLVGGVEVYVDKKLKYNDNAGDLHINLEPGNHKLNGYEAMGYVRIRKVDSDFVRQSRQKDFLLSFKDSVEKNPAKLPQVANEVVNLFGGELNNSEIAALIRFARGISQDNVKFGMIPITERSGTTNLYVDYSKMSKTLEEFEFIPATTVTSLD